jgi:hypothetical protein
MANEPNYIEGVITRDKVQQLAEHLNITPVEAYVAQQMPQRFILQTLITMYGRKTKCNAPEVRWYTDGYIPFSDVTSAEYTITAADAANTLGFILPLTHPEWLMEGQLFHINSTAIAGTNGMFLKLFVEKKTSAGVMVKVINAPNPFPAGGIVVPENTSVSYEATAHGERYWGGKTRQNIPVERYNTMQNLFGRADMSEWQKLSATEVNLTLLDRFNAAIRDFKILKDSSYITGTGEKFFSSTENADVQTCKGFAALGVPNYNTPATWNMDYFVELLHNCFRSPAGNDTKYLLVGSDFSKKLSPFINSRDFAHRARMANDKSGFFSLRWTEFETDFGQLLKIIWYPILNELGKSNSAICIDAPYLGEGEFISMRQSQTEEKDRNITGDNGSAMIVNQVACPMIHIPDSFALFNYFA